ncbi:MAG: intein-containing recombinase RecA [Actinomycetota bacterium]|nr:intein-containing recombinase RecA [Actinomycetota bacterium]
MALGQIEKQFGTGAIMRMGENAHVKVAAIPTGALSLDLALGIGGLPRGRVVEIYGPESSGKCLTADSALWTERGLETVAELFTRCGQPVSCTSRVTDVSRLGVRVVNERGELEQVAALTHNNRRPVLCVRLRSGRTLTVTHNHPLRVIGERGVMVWRQAGQIAVGDTVVSAAFGAVEAAAGEGLSEDEAVLVGHLVAGGSLSARSVRFTSSNPEVGGEFTRLMESLFGVEVRCPDGTEYAVQRTPVRALLAERYGLDDVDPAGKTVPHCVRTGGHKAQRAFLSALFEGNGWVDNSSAIGLGTASQDLARQVQLLLYGFGIPATVAATDSTGDGYWTVTIDAAAAPRFLAEIGFRSARRRAQVAATFRPSHQPQLDNDAILASRREAVVNRYTFEAVEAITDAGMQPTYDLALPATHSFVANGFVSHNTTVALHAIAEAQRTGGIAAFIDAEHALDPSYASALGVDVEALLVSQPDTGEQALEITDMLVRSGAVDIVVIDSVAALTPRAEIEGEMGDTHVGLQARLMSQALRKLAANLNRSRTCAVFINQLREKIGVMFGCFSSDTRVTLADGTQEEIGTIVGQRLAVEVLSYDAESGRVVPRRVVNWFDNGPAEQFLQVAVANGDGDGQSQFACTPSHRISTPGGWREARELRVGDRVLQGVAHSLSDFQWDVLLGAVMGAGALFASRNGHAATFRFRHGGRDGAYAEWAAALFANVDVDRAIDDDGTVCVQLQPLPELAELHRAVHVGGKKVLSHDYLKRLTPLSLGIWYADAGSLVAHVGGAQKRPRGGGRSEICIEPSEASSRRRLVEWLADEWDLHPTLRTPAGTAVLEFSEEETVKLHALVAPYVHPSMDDKLLPEFRGRFAVEPVLRPVRRELVPVPVRSIETRPPAPTMHRFDIEVEGIHNYLVDGIVVHNSPEITPGGRALKFYSSVRLDVRRIESLKDGTDAVGNRVRVKVVKNKCLAAGTRVFDPTTGLTHTIDEIVDGGAGAAVWAADKAGKLHVRPITARFNQGRQEVLTVELRGGGSLRVTPDHRVLTELGWKHAGELSVGDRVARPRRAGGFGDRRPVPVDHARMLGYLIGDGYVGGSTPIASVNTEESLHGDAAEIASTLGWDRHPTSEGMAVHFSHRRGERDVLLDLARWAGIYGHLGPDKRIPAALFSADVAEDVIANLLFGIFESGGWITRGQASAIRCGFTTTSQQLAQQIHWLLLRWGVGSTVAAHQPGGRQSLIVGTPVTTELPCWEVRISGMDNAERFAAAIPTWGPRGQKLVECLDDPALDKHRGSQMAYLATTVIEPVGSYLQRLGVTAAAAARMIGNTAGDPRGGMRQVLGAPRLRRDRLTRLAEALDSAFLHDLLDEDVYFAAVTAVGEREWAQTYDVGVEELHNLVAEDVVVHNCAPPFRQAEFDIMYGEGISREGSIIDVGVEHGIVKKAGAWYTYQGEQLGQGRENARKFLREHDDVAAEIYKKVTEQLGLVPVDVTGDEAADDG